MVTFVDAVVRVNCCSFQHKLAVVRTSVVAIVPARHLQLSLFLCNGVIVLDYLLCHSREQSWGRFDKAVLNDVRTTL